MKKTVILIAVFTALIVGVNAQTISYTTPGGAYVQDFDSLSNSGTTTWTNNSTIPGWYAAHSGTSATATSQYVASAGALVTGQLYSYGSIGSSERALGTLTSDTSGHIFVALALTNNTGSDLSQFDVSYSGEQWRVGNSTAQSAIWEYQFFAAGAGSITEASGWTAVPTLEFVSPQTSVTTGTTGSIDGNDSANRTALGATVFDSWQTGQELWLRWTDNNAPSTDHGLAIDDFNFSAVPEPTTFAMLIGGIGILVAIGRSRRKS